MVGFLANLSGRHRLPLAIMTQSELSAMDSGHPSHQQIFPQAPPCKKLKTAYQ
ncbi:hypothetical protein BS47DRAFT_1340670 [Hydnum rufescens UP504]|uniref:Uncharacterized protein n=1 Tax=Hydnum rufescens UP504 TaxID=1448309 RepID=A0A9P6DWM0_9AGAM|nr:hypothetical protein BS47DRAFT_1340670 [Hydnum rufescens UP504]